MAYKIMHLTSVHKSNDTRIFIKECKTLQKAFFSVGLIAPNDKDEVVDGIHIYAVPKAKNRKERILRTIWQVYKLAISHNADIYHFHDPELIPIGLLLKVKGKKVIYDVHEDVPKQILSKYWIPIFLRKIISEFIALLENISAKIFDGIVAATPSIAKRFPKSKTIIVQNFPIIPELTAGEEKNYNSRQNNIIYIGGLSEIRGIKEMVQAIDILPKTFNAKLVLAGNFSPPQLEDEIKNLSGWKYVDYKGWVSREEAAFLLSESRIGLVLLHPVPNYIESYPIKLFEYMSAGIPVIASNFELWREIVESVGCGLLVNPLEPKEIVNAIKWILEHPNEAERQGRRGKEAVIKRYNWESEAIKLISFYNKLLNKI
jgi:glycosyltransferase involved in cell wall biosynthesis